ncbi:helix-turn-helix transcriptional regulator [Streptomyces sp. NPDC008086]|uniref:helix-turn-helix transcriptional regulator n=1 Tax=Streptomyces sp. NPDC008086 TaxID=3364807 RepID=UPI0036E3F74B
MRGQPHVPEGHTHGLEELCEAGKNLYAQALREGRVRTKDANDVSCLADLGLVQPMVEDLDWSEPVSPALAQHRLLQASAQRIANERQREEKLAEIFAPLMRFDGQRSLDVNSPAIRVLTKEQINPTINEAMATSGEMLCIQPNLPDGDPRAQAARAIAMDRDQALLDRGGRIRTLYQHTQRHVPYVVARYEQLEGDLEARTLNEVTDRLIVLDRCVAFIPVSNAPAVALEIRHPALVSFFVTVFDRLWRLATPMYPEAVQPPSLNGVTPRQRAIAGLLVEGHTDAAIADRLGLNIRTARAHIAKLAATLGSDSRAQLGYLIGQSGILDQAG